MSGIYVSANPGFHANIIDVARCIKEAGFDGLFLNINEGDLSFEDVDAVRKQDLDIESLHLPYRNQQVFINELWADTENCIEIVSFLKKYIHLASVSGIKSVIMHVTNGYTPPPISSKGLVHFVRIADYCQQNGVRLAIENIKRFDYVQYLLSALRDYNVGFCFDIGHANAFTKNLYSNIWNDALENLSHVHIHDNNGINDLHLMPGMGNIDYSYIIPILKEWKPDINMTLELYYKGREKYYDPISLDEFYHRAYLSVINCLGEGRKCHVEEKSESY